MRLTLVLLIALVSAIGLTTAQSSTFAAVAANLFLQHETTPGYLNDTAFEEFYHHFLGGEPEHDADVEPPPCPDAESVFAIFDTDTDGQLNVTEFESALVDMVTNKAIPCELVEEVAPVEECKNSRREAWGYSFLATFIICLLSLVGALLWLILKSLPRIKLFVTNFMIAFAIGTLVADAILHIMPEMWGLHAHGGGEEEAHGAHGEGEHDKWEELKFLWPGMTVLGSLLFFWILEMLILAFLGHSHGSEHVSNTTDDSDKESKHSLPKSTGWLNLCAEVVHNFLDGIAIGVAFSLSNSLGVSTAIAVGAHELPQELGDFALLVESGFPMWQALLLNLGASLSALVGVCVGVAAGNESEEAQKYLLAFAAGGFLYIALASMFPSLRSLARGSHKIWLVSLQVVGVVMGFVVLLIIAITEPDEEC